MSTSPTDSQDNKSKTDSNDTKAEGKNSATGSGAGSGAPITKDPSVILVANHVQKHEPIQHRKAGDDNE
ncbi:MAG: hypothetical protein JNM43_16340 [Planctomycetaceae bacterium]|nr:hypothetical protein [Planctomycetaceae bacterium]